MQRIVNNAENKIYSKKSCMEGIKFASGNFHMWYLPNKQLRVHLRKGNLEKLGNQSERKEETGVDLVNFRTEKMKEVITQLIWSRQRGVNISV